MINNPTYLPPRHYYSLLILRSVPTQLYLYLDIGLMLLDSISLTCPAFLSDHRVTLSCGVMQLLG